MKLIVLFIAPLVLLTTACNFGKASKISTPTSSNASATTSSGQSQDKTILANMEVMGNLTMFTAAIKTAGLDATLDSGSFTVFAPTNQAMQALPKATFDSLQNASNRLPSTSLLTYHIVTGAYDTKSFANGQVLKTINGKTLKITKNGNTVKVNDATIEIADIKTSNGVIHSISSVLAQ